jgi:hypothetical protein
VASSGFTVTGRRSNRLQTDLWLYGYFATGHPSLFDWHANTPWWIADFLTNIESEIEMALLFAGMVPIYWPFRR